MPSKSADLVINKPKLRTDKRKALFATIMVLTVALAGTFQIATPVAEGQLQANITTYAFIAFGPNPVGVGQQVNIRPFLIPFPPTGNDVCHNFTLQITAPDGTVQNKGPFTSDTNGAVNYYFVPKQVGEYTVLFNYPGEFFSSVNQTYLSCDTTETLTVQNASVQGPPDYPLPTGYWTFPINAQDRSWNGISGNWLQGGYSANGRMYGDSAAFNPYSNDAPKTAHVVWTAPITFGGIIGGEFISNSYYSGLQYSAYATPPIVINGRLYYNLMMSSSGSATAGTYPGFACVDLATGKVLWQNPTGRLTFAQIYVSVGGNGAGGRAFLYDTTAANWTLYDAFTGMSLYKLYGSPGNPRTVLYGPNGDVYAYYSGGTAAKPWLLMWNGTQAWEQYGFIAAGSLLVDAAYYGGSVGAFNWSKGIAWNVTVPSYSAYGFSAPSIYAADSAADMVEYNSGLNAAAVQQGYSNPPQAGVIVLSASPVLNPNSAGQQVLMGYNSLTGQLIWNNTYTWIGLSNNRYSCGAGYLIHMNMGTLARTAIDLKTGAIVWDSTPTEAPWGMYTGYGINAYGMSYTGTYSGNMVALDLKTGQQVWSFSAGVSGEQTPYNSWPMFNGPIVGGHIVYCGYSEHTPSTPLYTGGHLYALDSATGKEIWSFPGWLSLRALAQGYLVTVNMYDMQMYVIGKGPSQTTVQAPLAAVPLGQGVTITGTVTDQSTGQAGTPAISDANMSAWMAYLKEQLPLNGTVTGVPVNLTSVAPDGTTTNIGITTSDMYGAYGISWTPQAQGTYQIVATFAGSDSYGSSTASTYLTVGSALPSPVVTTPTPTQTTTPTATPTTSPSPAPPVGTENYTAFYVAVAAVIIIAVVAALAVVLRRRK